MQGYVILLAELQGLLHGVWGGYKIRTQLSSCKGKQTEDNIVLGYDIPLGVAWGLRFRVVLTSCDNYCVVGFISELWG